MTWSNEDDLIDDLVQSYLGEKLRDIEIDTGDFIDKHFKYDRELGKQLVERAYNVASEDILDGLGRFSSLCESPIEKIMAAALIIVSRKHSAIMACAVFRSDGQWISSVDHQLAFELAADIGKPLIYPQTIVGSYRADFMAAVPVPTETGIFPKFIAVECDGHDYHERTAKQASRDRKRDRWMAKQGITVLRFTGSEIWRDPIDCAQSVFEMIDVVKKPVQQPVSGDI